MQDYIETNTDQNVTVHAGFPNPAAGLKGSNLKLDQLLIEHPVSTFLFRIRGNDWEHRGIFDGDIAIIDRAADSRPSDLVVWWYGDSFKITRRKLVPGDVATWGVITSVIHQFRKTSRYGR